jgi:hypothetical protein
MVSLKSYRYSSGFSPSGGFDSEEWRNRLWREVAMVGGHDLEFVDGAEGCQAVFTVPARDGPDAFAIGEKVMRAVSPGGLWFGASRAEAL